MSVKTLVSLILCIFIPVSAVFSQAEEGSSVNFWISPAAETAMYDVADLAFGGGFALGIGSGVSLGLRAAYFIVPGGISTIELNFLLRFFLFGAGAVSGPFLQAAAGPAIFTGSGDDVTVPSELGMISAGLSFGWRFLFLNRWFVEPAIRGGYPYLAGAGVSAGVRF
jgi:hypothetical protein